MKKVEMTLKASIPFKGDVKVVDSPDNQENIKVLEINGKYYMPAFDFMVYETSDDLPDELKSEGGSWVSLDFQKFENITGNDDEISFDYNFEIEKE